MEMQLVHEVYHVNRPRKNVIAALRRKGFTVEYRRGSFPSEFEITMGRISNLHGRLTSETPSGRQRLDIYGPSRYFDKLRTFAQTYPPQERRVSGEESPWGMSQEGVSPR